MTAPTQPRDNAELIREARERAHWRRSEGGMADAFVYDALADALEAATAPASARPEKEWHEDMGDVLWWKFPITEAPYVGSPLDLGYTVEMHAQSGLVAKGQVGGWPGYHTHFTPLPPPPKAEG